METKHTPGPWHVSRVFDYGFDVSHVKTTPVFVGDQNHVVAVAQMIAYGKTTEEFVANTRIIAAAPELLEALKRLAPILDNDGPLAEAYADIRPLVEAAIGKAEGR